MRFSRRVVSLALTAVCASWSVASHAGLAEANAALETQDYQAARTEFEPLAVRGNTQAQFAMGQIHINGWGTAKDYAQAHHWYCMAAQRGHAEAQFTAGVLYGTGSGLEHTAKHRAGV